MIRKTAFLAVLASCFALCVPGETAETGEFIFFGVVTVRDGKTVLFQNPKLSKEQAEKHAETLEHMLDLDRTFTTTRNKEGVLEYKWGAYDEGQITKEGLVPYVAYFATRDQFVDVDEANAKPCVMRMGFSSSTTTRLVMVSWWAPETTKTSDISVAYYPDSSHKTVAVLKGDKIAASAGGTSPDGVKWKITRVEEKKNEVVVTVETSKGPDGHKFVFWTATTKFKTPTRSLSWAKETMDGEGLAYAVSFWAESTEELVSLEILERDPDRMKTWAIKGFVLKSK